MLPCGSPGLVLLVSGDSVLKLRNVILLSFLFFLAGGWIAAPLQVCSISRAVNTPSVFPVSAHITCHATVDSCLLSSFLEIFLFSLTSGLRVVAGRPQPSVSLSSVHEAPVLRYTASVQYFYISSTFSVCYFLCFPLPFHTPVLSLKLWNGCFVFCFLFF